MICGQRVKIFFTNSDSDPVYAVEGLVTSAQLEHGLILLSDTRTSMAGVETLVPSKGGSDMLIALNSGGFRRMVILGRG